MNESLVKDRGAYVRREGRFVSTLTIVLVGISAFILGFALSRTGIFSFLSPSDEENTTYTVGNRTASGYIDFNLFWNVWEKVEDEYVIEGVDQKEMFIGAVKGAVDGLDDPGSVYFTAEEYSQYQEQSEGSYEGVGMYLGYSNGFIIIEQPIKGSPAEASGAKAGDIITKVDGEQIDGKSIEEVVLMIRGERGTTVTVTVFSKGDSGEHDLVMTRDEITVPAISWEQKEDGIVVIEISRFTESTLKGWENEWDKVVSEVAAISPRAVIVDLRSNGGGYLDAGVYAAEEFLPMGATVTTQEAPRQGLFYDYVVKREGKLTGVNVIVLVNEYTASASEIFAGALQKNNRGTVVGEETTGKGTAQQIFEFDDGSALKLTVAHWKMPDGVVLSEDNPIKPDIVLEFDETAFEQGTDNQMNRALEELKK